MTEYLYILPQWLQFLLAWPLIIFLHAEKRRGSLVPGPLMAGAVLWFVGISLPIWTLNLPAILIWKLFSRRQIAEPWRPTQHYYALSAKKEQAKQG